MIYSSLQKLTCPLGSLSHLLVGRTPPFGTYWFRTLHNRPWGRKYIYCGLNATHTWVSGSPNRQLNSRTLGPSDVSIKPAYRTPENRRWIQFKAKAYDSRKHLSIQSMDKQDTNLGVHNNTIRAWNRISLKSLLDKWLVCCLLLGRSKFKTPQRA